MAAIDSTSPTGSRRWTSGSLDVGTTAATVMTATITMGTLTRNTEPHQKCSSSQPPVTGPRATARPLMAAQMPMAAARSFGARNTLTRMARVAGKMRAAPMPIRARQAMSWPGSPDQAAPAEKPAKSTSPTIRAPLRPQRSPRLPAASKRPANTSV